VTKPNPFNIERRKNHRRWRPLHQIRNQRHPKLIIPEKNQQTLNIHHPVRLLVWARTVMKFDHLLIASRIVALSWSQGDSLTVLNNPRFFLEADTRSTLKRTVSTSDISLSDLVDNTSELSWVLFRVADMVRTRQRCFLMKLVRTTKHGVLVINDGCCLYI
jgi:hypothetical protein